MKPLAAAAVCSLILSAITAEAQERLASQDFEGPDFSGYSTLGGLFQVVGADYWRGYQRRAVLVRAAGDGL